MAALTAADRKYVIRFPTKRFKPINDFWASTDEDRMVTLTCSAQAQAEVVAREWPQTIQVRLIKVVPDTGESDVLVTNLLDAVAYPRDQFKALYDCRWTEETYSSSDKYFWSAAV
jgi:hypothetical protein